MVNNGWPMPIKKDHLIYWKEVDGMRQESDDNLMKAFQFIYRYGTVETKEKLSEIGFDLKSK